MINRRQEKWLASSHSRASKLQGWNAITNFILKICAVSTKKTIPKCPCLCFSCQCSSCTHTIAFIFQIFIKCLLPGIVLSTPHPWSQFSQWSHEVWWYYYRLWQMGNWDFTGQVNLYTDLSKRFLNANSGSPCVPLHGPWDHCRHPILFHIASGASLGLPALPDTSSATHWQDHTWILPWSRGFHLWNSITHPRPQHHPTWLTVLLPSMHALFLSSGSSAYLLPRTCAPSGARFSYLRAY